MTLRKLLFGWEFNMQQESRLVVSWPALGRRVAGVLFAVFCLAVGSPWCYPADTPTETGRRFFRIVGPAPVTITSFAADGNITWTNELTNATYTVQTVTALGGASNWVDWIVVSADQNQTTSRIADPNPPSGMVFIPAGNFVMGNTFSEGSSDELPTHTVYVSAFYMDKYEVNKAKWDEVYNWAIANGYGFDNAGQGKADNHPVHTVSWYDVVKWCNARSEKEGLTPAYYTNAAQTTVYRTGLVSVQNDWVKWDRGYRLPTEAEWEKAARGGLGGKRFPWGDTINHSQANYYSYWSGGVPYYSYDRSLSFGHHPSYQSGEAPYTSPVGSFAANGYGLYDMTGNLWEWCWDWYDVTFYSTSSATDPRGPASGSNRVARGGSWDSYTGINRSANRGTGGPTGRSYSMGFRPVLPPIQ